MPKFTCHSRGLHIIGILSGTAILLAKMIGFSLHRRNIIIVHLLRIYLSSMHKFRGGKSSHLRVCSHHYPKTSIFLSMPVLLTIVQKGRDCKSKVLPLSVLDIVGQNSRGTNIVFEYKQMLRFLENKKTGKTSR